jgi:predicted GIY-YIG superfamily endonuclease
MAKRTGVIYLLHFSSAYHHARHYVGFTTDLASRLDAHQRGDGARLLEVIGAAGIGFELARTWSGTRHDERAIKNRKAAPRLCPTCNPNNRRAMTPEGAKQCL